MAKRRVFTATMPDGVVIKRTSESRVYQFVVVGRCLDATLYREAGETRYADAYGVIGWCSRGDLAQRLAHATGQERVVIKARRTLAGRRVRIIATEVGPLWCQDVRILPVEEVVKP